MDYSSVKAGKNKVISMSYQLFRLEPENPKNLQLLEEKTVDEPMEFLFGESVVLEEIEKCIQGEGAGFKDRIEVPPKAAFGFYNEDLKIWMDKSKFPKELELTLGMKFQTQGPHGDVISVIVKDIDDDRVLVDGNHPLAGMILLFDIQILRVREATPEEIKSKKVLKVLH